MPSDSSPERTYCEAYVERSAIPFLVDILDRVQEGDGCLGAQEEWYNEVFSVHPIPLRHESGTFHTDDRIKRATDARDALRRAGSALNQLLDCISSQAATADEHIKTLRLRRGFSSLPDEILSIILKEASYEPRAQDIDDDPAVQTVSAATKLSHTCQRFRRLLLSTPSLWNRISSLMPLRIAQACCDRITTANAEVELREFYEDQDSLEFAKFIRVTTSVSRFWRRFAHLHPWTRDVDDDFDDLKGLAMDTLNLDAPSLTELSIRHPHYAVPVLADTRLREALHYYATWSMPKLSKMTTLNLIPIPFANSASLRSLDISMMFLDADVGRFDFPAFIMFVSSCKVLEKLALDLSFLDEIYPTPGNSKRRLRLDSVKEVDLSIRYCSSDLIKTILGVLDLPAVQSMAIDVAIHLKDEGDVIPVDVDSFTIFPEKSHFPSLVELRLAVDLRRYGDPLRLILQLPKLEKVRQLTLKTEGVRLAPLPEGKCLPALRSLVLEKCHRLDENWINAFLERLVTQGNFDGLQLTVKNCMWKKFGSTLRSAGAQYVKVTADEMLHLVV